MDVDAFILVGILASGVAVIAKLFKKDPKAEARLDAEWERAARRLGGTDEGRKIRVTVGESTFGIWPTTEAAVASNTRNDVTRLEGRLRGLSDVDIRVSARGALGKLTSALPLGVHTGDEDFDKAFAVKGRPAPLVRAFLDGRMLRTIEDSGATFEIEGGILKIDVAGHPEEAEPIVRLGRYGQALAERWEALAQTPYRFAEKIGLGPLGRYVELGRGGVLVARGVRRGREVTSTVRVVQDAIVTELAFESAQGETVKIELQGLEPDDRDANERLEAALDGITPTNAYR